MSMNIDERTYTDQAGPDAARERRSTRQRLRLGAFYIPLVLAGVMTIMFLPELLATLVTGFTAAGAVDLGIHRLHVMGIAAVVAVFLLGLFVQAYKPRRRVAAMWGAFLTIVIASAGTIYFGVGRPEEVIPFLVLTGAALIAHPAGRGLIRRVGGTSPAMIGLLALAAIPVLAFVVTQLSLTTHPTDPHAVDGHYVMMIALVMAPLAYGAVSALGLAGWRLAAWLAAAPMAYYGVLSMVFLDQVGSTGVFWGAAAIIWAVAFVAVAEYSRRTDSRWFGRRR